MAASPQSRAWDSTLEILGKAAEGALISPEFLRLQRQTLDLMCGHRDLWLKMMAEQDVKPRTRGRRRR